MTRSRKERRARKRLLQRKTANRGQRDALYPICPDCGQRHEPDVDWDGDALWDDDDEDDWNDLFGFYHFPKEAFERFTQYDEAVYWGEGAMLKFYPSRVIVRASQALQETKELESFIAEMTIRHYADFDRFESIRQSEGVDAAMECFGMEDLESDWEYWDDRDYWDEASRQQRSPPQPPTDLRDAALLIRHRRADDEWIYELPENVTVQFRADEVLVQGPHEIIDLIEFRFMITDAILDLRGLRKEFLRIRDTQGGNEAMKLMGKVTFDGLDGRSLWNWNVPCGD